MNRAHPCHIRGNLPRRGVASSPTMWWKRGSIGCGAMAICGMSAVSMAHRSFCLEKERSAELRSLARARTCTASLRTWGTPLDAPARRHRTYDVTTQIERGTHAGRAGTPVGRGSRINTRLENGLTVKKTVRTPSAPHVQGAIKNGQQREFCPWRPTGGQTARQLEQD